MKYIKPSGSLCVLSEDKGKFVDFMTAVMALNAVQMFYASLGFYVSSTICKKPKLVEVNIHFDTFDMPVLPTGYLYSRREVTSQAYESNYAKPGERVRVVSYSFEF